MPKPKTNESPPVENNETPPGGEPVHPLLPTETPPVEPPPKTETPPAPVIDFSGLENTFKTGLKELEQNLLGKIESSKPKPPPAPAPPKAKEEKLDSWTEGLNKMMGF